jgi:epoxyqueuosine reductase
VPIGTAGEAGARLQGWLAGGLHGSMEWMARTAARRADPRLHYPEAKSVIVVAMNYFTPHQHQAAGAKISRYAWGDDYHDVLKERLSALRDWLAGEVADVEGWIAVDTSPVMDKAWAVRAGLGWMGQHSSVSNPELGSWLFLGELFVNVELQHDSTTIPDQCGTCTACIDACPTGAIVEPYVVDARRCISYLTIESRAETLPLPTHGWIFGCDICQDVCPWNRFQQPTAEPRFEPRDGLLDPDTAELERLDAAAFTERFRGSAIKRTKLSGLVRNVRHVRELPA